jgi:hypothetical protein
LARGPRRRVGAFGGLPDLLNLYISSVIPDSYVAFFAAAAGTSGALIGLLFVAITVAPERSQSRHAQARFRARAGASLIAFSNALVLSLATLVPSPGLDWWAGVTGLAMLAYGLGVTRTLIVSARAERSHSASFAQDRQQVGLVVILVVIGVLEVFAAVRLFGNPSDVAAVNTLSYLVIFDLIGGISRAWQLTSMPDIGLFSSLRSIAGRDEPEPPED